MFPVDVARIGAGAQDAGPLERASFETTTRSSAGILARTP